VVDVEEQTSGWLDRPLSAMVRWDWESMAWIALMLIAAVARFYDVGARAMTHDESLHTLYSYYLYDHGEYVHNPMMHGPFLFHINAFFYALFGDNDSTARLAPVLAGLGVVWMARLMRPYLGRLGALFAGILLAVSPSLLFHSRYIRNDIYIALFTMVWIYGAFRYLDTRRFRWMMVMALGMAFGFISKENHFITGAIVGPFFAGLAIWQMVMQKGWSTLRHSPSADVAVTMLTLVLPFTAPLGHELMGWDPMANGTTEELMRSVALVSFTTGLSLIIAFFWFGLRGKAPEVQSTNSKKQEQVNNLPSEMTFGQWGRLMGIFWLIQILFFTTFFTNVRDGLATGVVGSLGYWLGQHDVKRGSQPWFYYFLIGTLYEFLPMILTLVGTAVAGYWTIFKRTWEPVPELDLASDVDPAHGITLPKILQNNRVYFVIFTIWWTVASWIGYTWAGEKMPWLLTHMALPMCVFGGWYLGRLVRRVDWEEAKASQSVWLAAIAPALLFTLWQLANNFPSFSRELGETNNMLQWVLALLVSLGLIYLILRWGSRSAMSSLRLLSLGMIAIFFLLTIRFSYMLTYINYDLVTEYLVYAHGSPDIKRALNEIDLLSERTVGERNIMVAYDDDSSWPLSWYMRLYPNSRFYGDNPNSDAMAAPVIIVGPKNYDKVRPYVARDYVKRTYRLVWWPDQGYFSWTWDNVTAFFTDPEVRKRGLEIAFYRRYRDNSDNTQLRNLNEWPNRHDFEMYVRRDIAAEIWDLGATPIAIMPTGAAAQLIEREIDLSADVIHSGQYDSSGLTDPRSITAGANGEKIIADTGNNRIVILDGSGNFVRSFGSQCKLGEGEAGGCVDPDGDGPLELGDGQFFEPWGIDADAQGNIYVSDTWNGRIQVFDNEGNFLRKWGRYGSTNGELTDANALFGPRGLAVDSGGNLLVADTGNKRIIQFTPDGELVNQVGGGGVILGRFEEPVDVAVNQLDGSVYVSDAWNQRIQKLTANLEAVEEWVVPGWESQHIHHKPFLDVDMNGNVYTSDPEFFRIFVFGPDGEMKSVFGNYGTDLNRKNNHPSFNGFSGVACGYTGYFNFWNGLKYLGYIGNKS